MRRAAARSGCAIARQRSIAILADEPTGNLDTGNTETITALFLSLAENYGKTVIMVSHDPKAVERFKRVYHMRDGTFVQTRGGYDLKSG